MLAVLAGCSGGEAPPVAAEPSSAGSSEAPAPSPAAAGSQVDPDRPETRWIGNIPYDVFFDQPLTVATDTTPIGNNSSAALASAAPGVAPPENPAPATAPFSSPPAAPAGSSTAAAAVDWPEILPMAALVEEVKLLRTRLTANLNTVATFNKSTPAISLDGAVLTALAAIAIQHPEEVSWKSRAPAIRDLSYKIYENADGSGREPFAKAKEPFELAMTLLDGGNPPEGSSEEEVPFGEVVYVADLMKRIEASFNFLKSNINTEARLKEDPVTVERELRILAALGTIIRDPSYDSADEEEYQKLAVQLADGALAGTIAAKTGSFAEFQSALNRAQTSCAECHSKYRGSSSGF